ncbi:hyaluronate lyase N-terminal domain-containing protein [Pantoea anthophila]|uniref:hyaluronate lyase N-terminal domain-containing protein n=1 Tax=Pantoea anthophila TaxID=470931 RepID=UPI002DB83C06|nr:hypothetical protein [Pantoea anthophila]MEB6223709.1 hypothetical protein [Pantoea anthophila]
MASSVQIKRGTTAKVAAYTPLEGELVLDLTTKKLYAGDGTTVGGNQIFGSRKGVTDGSSAATGDIGEVMQSTTLTTSMTNATSINLATITLTPGDWELTGVVSIRPSSATLTQVIAGMSTTTAATPVFPNRSVVSSSSSQVQEFNTPSVRYILSAPTTIYLVASAGFTSGTVTGDGYLKARRVR